jgi:polyphenol oxidase
LKDFVFRASGPIKLLFCEPLERAGFIHAFSTRLGGASSLPSGSLSLGNFRQDSRENVLENRRRFQTALNAADWPLVTANQIHSADVRAVLDSTEASAEPTTCDALTANLPRTLLAVQTADCMPVLLVDQRTRAFAAIHAGWRGTLAHIVARTLERMQLSFDTRPDEVLAAFGPAIGACCFEVGPEVIEQFEREFQTAERAISNRQINGKAYLNLGHINRHILMGRGVKPENIFDCELCTACRTDLFFSYRRERGAEQAIGRLMGVVGREV